jgi:hypothetical protein
VTEGHARQNFRSWEVEKVGFSGKRGAPGSDCVVGENGTYSKQAEDKEETGAAHRT